MTCMLRGWWEDYKLTFWEMPDWLQPLILKNNHLCKEVTEVWLMSATHVYMDMQKFQLDLFKPIQFTTSPLSGIVNENILGQDFLVKYVQRLDLK